MEVTSQPDAVPIWIIAGHLEAASGISLHAGASEAVSPSDIKTFGWREDGSPGVLQMRTHSSPDPGKNSLVSEPLSSHSSSLDWFTALSSPMELVY